MTDYYTDIRALIDPEQSDPLPEGGRAQDISLILTDESGSAWLYQMSPAGITLGPDQARELAFSLLEVAEHADRMREGR